MFRRTLNSEQLVHDIEPQMIKRFLLRSGFVLKGIDDGHSEAYESPDKRIILVPLDRNLADYARCVNEIIETIAEENGFSPDDVVALLVLPTADILRYRVETPETKWGHIRLGYGYEAIHALFDVLKYTAAGVSTGHRDYQNVSTAAKDYANLCHFGQTELGSYVMKVFCPVRPAAAAPAGDEPFGRASTRSVVENFQFIDSEVSQDPSQPLPPTLNHQVASAVQRLKPDSDFARSVLTVRYTPLGEPGFGVPTPITEEAHLDLGPFIYARAQSLRDRLKRTEEASRELVTGHIINLHKDRPTLLEPSRQITLDVKYGSSFRKVTMRLLPAEYHCAVMWHDTDTQVRLDAVFDKRGRPWSVARLYDLSPLDPTDPEHGLFEAPPD